MSAVCSCGLSRVGGDGGEDASMQRMDIGMSHPNRMKRCSVVLLLCLVWSFIHTNSHAAAPTPPTAAMQAFADAKRRGDVAAVFRRFAQQDTKEAVIAIVYAGLSEAMLADLGVEPTQQMLQTAREALTGLSDIRAWKAVYKAVYKHPDWRVRSMLLDVVRTRLPDEPRAEKAVARAIGDSTDAVSHKAIDMAGEFRLKRTVPKLMKMVIAKWGQHVGVSAAKATLALERITGSAEPADWQAWVNQNL